METFGERLKELREKKQLTEKELAMKIGVNLGTLKNWEKGLSKPRIHFMMRIARLFEVRFDYLVGYTKS